MTHNTGNAQVQVDETRFRVTIREAERQTALLQQIRNALSLIALVITLLGVLVILGMVAAAGA